MNQKNKESLHSLVLRSVDASANEKDLSVSEKNLQFAMGCNGYFMSEKGQWQFNPAVATTFSKEFSAQNISFSGTQSGSRFFSDEQIGHKRFLGSFNQPPLLSSIAKYREIDENLAARIAFIFGGIVRDLAPQGYHLGSSSDEIGNAVKFASKMTMLGERRSCEAVASAIAMYIICGGSLKEDNHFVGNIYRMAEAIGKDPIIPLETEDLGLSQVLRLRTFVGGSMEPLYDIVPYQTDFDSFPTVGAEFHFGLDAPKKYPNFWQRLAILNMSQYQAGSFVRFSRKEKGVVEVRMNPSISPVTIADWNQMRLLLPELNQAFFTITLNRDAERGDFSWASNEDKGLLNNLRAIGMLTYAGIFNNVPQTVRSGEIDFGGIYLGQTVKINNGEYVISGKWGGVREGQNGQLAIYSGFGDSLPHLAYNLSMVLANPNILNTLGLVEKETLSNIRTLDQALRLSSGQRQSIFRAIQRRIEHDGKLKKAFESGDKIVSALDKA